MRETCSKVSRHNSSLIVQVFTPYSLTLHNISITNDFVLAPDPQIIVFWAPPSAAGHETGAAQLSCGVGGCLIGWKWQLVSRPPSTSSGSRLVHTPLFGEEVGVGDVGPLSGTCPDEHPLPALRQTDKQTLRDMWSTVSL